MTPLRRLFLPALLSGGLLWLAYFPVNAGAVALVALAPFLTLVRAESPRRWVRYLAAFAGGFLFFALAIKWVRVAHPMMLYFTWPVGAAYCACYWPLALYFLRRADRAGLPFTVTLPAVWVTLEYVRTHFPTGFSFLEPLGVQTLVGFNWYCLGYALHGFLPAVQAADLGGVYLVSAAVAVVNGAAHDWMMRSTRVRRLFRWPPVAYRRGAVWEAYGTAWAMLFPALLVCYGTVQLGHPPYAAGPRVALVQGNVPQNEKVLAAMEAAAQAGKRGPTPLELAYLPAMARAARPAGSDPPPDLVVIPETCYPVEWIDPGPALPAGGAEAKQVRDYQARFLAGLGRLPPTNYLLGLNRLEWAGAADPAKFNAALLVDRDFRAVASYDKMHLVPFGEYVPFQSPYLKLFTPHLRDYVCVPGARLTRFPVTAADGRAYTFGALICYEDTDPYLARQYNPASGRTEGVDFLVNQSNDGWFANTEEQQEHLAVCRFRAVEARRSVVRAVNTGVSAVIDPDGRVVALPDGGGWAASANKRAVVRATVPLSSDTTVYAAVGDWVPLAGFLIYVGLRLWPVVGRRLLAALARRVRAVADVPADRRVPQGS